MTDKPAAKKSRKKEFEIGQVPSNFWYHIVGENILVSIIAFFTGIKVKPDPDYLKEEGPIIVVSNHESYLDPAITSRLTYGRPGNFVCGEFLFRNHFWGWAFKQGGAIPKKQFTVDAISVKAMMKVLKRKGVLFIYPEATRSIDGSTVSFDDGVAKMAKKTGSAIYIAHIHGAYNSMPRWGKGIKWGKITAEFVKKLPASETSKMTAEEIHQYILDGIKYDENDYSRRTGLTYRSSNMAWGLQNIAYACPKCNSEFTMEWAGHREGDIIRCSKCGNSARMLPTGLIEPVSSEDRAFDDLHKWTSWEKEITLSQIQNDDFKMEIDVNLFKVFDRIDFANTGSGKAVITREAITYVGTDCPASEGIPYHKGKVRRGFKDRTLDGSKPVTKVFETEKMKGLVAGYGKYFEIYDSDGTLFRFMVSGNMVYKIQEIVALCGKFK